MRYLYAIAFGFYGKFTVLCEFCTVPNYGVIGWFMMATMCKCGWDVDFHSKAGGALTLVLKVFVANVFIWLFFFIFNKPGTMMAMRGDAWEKKSKGTSLTENLIPAKSES